MSLKGRVKFAVIGTHPLLSLIRDHFIKGGLALVPLDQDPDFCLVGAGIRKGEKLPLAQLELQLMQAEDRPVFLLSSSDVYHDKDLPNRVNDSLTVVASSSPACSRSIYAIVAEHAFIQRGPTMVVRPFNIYGDNIRFGVVHEFITRARRKEPLIIHSSGYQERTFLHEDDFFTGIDALLAHFYTGKMGIYNTKTYGIFNIGATEKVSIKRLADSIWQLTQGGDTLYERKPADYFFTPRKCPDVSHLKSLGWKPKISLRAGIFGMVNK